mmetsp:Transcript_30732/g.35036  ORF Transcript_30732/g.35036 Transcript_30732/m.35036 type:complete len:552 (+) Transcript_30732:87-1742(+)|eukprot:CAMPEP_0194130644 /NCGR_PEP_ID=MMETSP0152-20130528/1639_1 /TAXON_ID=1049557 /ORGANISM="Thalassiothrix antarctica, Strain L6-D1" /LENGTH=551 /DNA_ID=CAMNT_0038825223 /DNA_START=6 /DNA_END=1664 /DNA_ORIENTATION=-
MNIENTVLDPSNKIERKRRLSRKEQKARKKLKRKNIESCNTNNKCFQEKTATVTERKKNNGERKEKNSETYPNEIVDELNNNESNVVEEDFLSNYKPIEIPLSIESSKEEPSLSLGKWFPKARVIKSRVSYTNADIKKTTAKSSLVLFYQYTQKPWSDFQVHQLVSYLTKIAAVRTIAGRVRVASEGVNATLSSVDDDKVSAKITLRHICHDLKRFDSEVFASTDFKFMDNLSPDRHFKDLKILPVQELVFYGWRSEEASLEKGGTHVSPREFHNMLEQDETVVIDVRNHYEAAIGRFDGQQIKNKEDSKSGNAEYLDPKLRKSTDFGSWLKQPETASKLQNKKILMYCTGGVRCERASAYLNSRMGSQIKGVYQLQGGIEGYLQEFSEDGGGHWRGKNFVFDKREAISVTNQNGDGGVVQKKTKNLQHQMTVETHCCLCKKPWDRYIGKKKCTMCGVPVLMCDNCMSANKKLKEVVLRCPLCIEQNITVPAADVEYTQNGICSKYEEEGNKQNNKKAAPSVLKWGGGHAQSKKDRKREERRRNQLKQKVC